MYKLGSIAPIVGEQEIFSISDLFHENTKVRYFHNQSEIENIVNQEIFTQKVYKIISRAFKDYPNSEKVKLAKNFPKSDPSIDEVILKRRSIRDFSGRALNLKEVSKLLFFAYGITGYGYYDDGSSQSFRSAPSGGALYPLEIYPVLLNVKGAKKGIYHYNVKNHLLELLREGDYRDKLYNYCLRQELVKTASIMFLITGVFYRSKFKYGERGYRYVLFDTGHLAQNIYLTATAMNLGPVSLGGFIDDGINEMLQIDGINESIIYIVAIGKIRKRWSSFTVKMAAAFRAKESEKEKGERLFFDPYAKKLAGIEGVAYAERIEAMMPGMGLMFSLRTKYIDDYLKKCLLKGIQQVVFLGVGYDCRAFRLNELKGASIFEVDRRSIILSKKLKLKEVVGFLPKNVTYIAGDLTKKGLWEQLIKHGYDTQKKTLFVLEGVTFYLNESTVDRILNFIASNSAEGSSVIFNYVHLSLVRSFDKLEGARQVISEFDRQGEPFTFGIDPDKIKPFLESRGYQKIVNSSTQQIKERYKVEADITANEYIVYATVKSQCKDKYR